MKILLKTVCISLIFINVIYSQTQEYVEKCRGHALNVMAEAILNSNCKIVVGQARFPYYKRKFLEKRHSLTELQLIGFTVKEVLRASVAPRDTIYVLNPDEDKWITGFGWQKPYIQENDSVYLLFLIDGDFSLVGTNSSPIVDENYGKMSNEQLLKLMQLDDLLNKNNWFSLYGSGAAFLLTGAEKFQTPYLDELPEDERWQAESARAEYDAFRKRMKKVLDDKKTEPDSSWSVRNAYRPSCVFVEDLKKVLQSMEGSDANVALLEKLKTSMKTQDAKDLLDKMIALKNRDSSQPPSRP